ncbi:MAG: hypothetical protein ACTSX7_06205 [Alphaproteobacteria bacterium]
MIAVFLNNKLIAADTVLPLLLEFHAKWPRHRFEFFCFDESTQRAIEANTIIADAMTGLGKLRMIGRRKAGPLALIGHRFRAAFTLARLVFLGLIGQAAFIHFKALNTWPLRLLYLANRRRTFYIQPTGVGSSDAEKRVDEINRPRRAAAHGPAATALVSFNQDWAPLHDPRGLDLPRYRLPPTYNRRHWHHHLDRQAERRLGPVLGELGCPAEARFVVFVLSSMDPTAMFTRPDMFPHLFEESLDAMIAAIPDVPVLVKPHPATTPQRLDFLHQAIAARAPAKIALSNLHPLLLARGAYCFIGNVFSSTFANAATMNLPTIEYTSYSDETLAATGGTSIRPDLVDHFINGDRAALEQILTHLVRQPPPPPPALIADDRQTEAFFAALHGRPNAEGAANPNPRSLEA